MDTELARRPNATAGPRPQATPKVHARPSRDADDTACRIAIAIVAVLCDVDAEDIARPSRSPATICEARHIAMYLAHVVFQVSLIRSSSVFGRDRTSIAHAVRRIEEKRDDPQFDARIEGLEALARSVRDAMSNAAGRGGAQ